MSHSTAVSHPGDLHDEQVEALLRSGAHAALLGAYFGEREYRQLCHYAKLAATRARSDGQRVYVLPGVMGSKLGIGGEHLPHVLWLHPAAVAHGGLRELATPCDGRFVALGVMLPGYLKLKLMLEIAGFRATFFPFDWRCDLFQLGQSLLDHIDDSGDREVMLVGHSMGGLVARAALTLDERSRIARLVQLGTPNEGSFAPVQALRAVYPTVRKIAALDRLHSAEALARDVFLAMPGLYQLLPTPGLCDAPDLFDPDAWPRDELAPNAALLAQARAARRRLSAADDRCFTIAGIKKETVTALRLVDGNFEYTVTRNGDGTVPLALAHWPRAKTWYASDFHGALTNNDTVQAAVIDLLQSGTTPRLDTCAPPVDTTPVRVTNDRKLRNLATRKVHWDELSLDSRRRILEPVISPEFM